MIANVLIVIFLALMVYWWGGVQGFFSAWIHMMCTILAGALALAGWEPMVHWVLLDRIPSLAWGVGLLGPFIFWLVLLRKTTDYVVRSTLAFDSPVEIAGGAVCGLLAATITSGLTLVGVGFLPASDRCWGVSAVCGRRQGTSRGQPRWDTVVAGRPLDPGVL